MKKSYILISVILLVLIIDQALKIWVKTNMFIGEDSFINWGWSPYWARIHFVENDGMAFGIKIWGPYGKLILSLFRIVAVGFLIYFIRQLLKTKASMGLLISFAFILAGAIGNILDSAFYGLFFSSSNEHHPTIAEFMPEAGGYANFLHGKVVDMFYFPMWEGTLPSWIPFWGGKYFEFFKPVFNIADVSISVGVISILLFQRSFFSADPEKEKELEVIADDLTEKSNLEEENITEIKDEDKEVENEDIEKEG